VANLEASCTLLRLKRTALCVFLGLVMMEDSLHCAATKPGEDSAATAKSRSAPTGPLSVRDFGAIGDGIADDTTAIQATINAAVTEGDPIKDVRKGIAAVYLPAGTYKITAPITLRSIERLKIFGDGLGLTWLAAAGKISSVLDLNGVAYCTFVDFSIRSLAGNDEANSFDAGIFLHWEKDESRRSTTNNRFYNIEVGGRFKIGFQIGAPGATNQVDQTQWHGCRVYGQWKAEEKTWWQAGWRVGAGVFANNLIHSIYSVDATHLRYGVHVWASQVAIYGGAMGSNAVDLYLQAVTSYCHVSGIRSESGGRLIESGGPTGYNANVTIEDVLWKVTTNMAADKHVISYNFPGTLVLRNVVIVGLQGKRLYPKLRFRSGVKSLSVIAEGLTIGGDQTLKDAFDTDDGVTVHAVGLNETGVGGGQSAHWVAPVVTTTTDYKINGADNVVFADARKVPVKIFLPNATGVAGRKLYIKRVSAGLNQVTISPKNGQTVDGAAVRILKHDNEAVTVVSDNKNWLTL
jgi:hypothetical protein